MAWSEDTIQKVWEKGKVVSNNPAEWRKDECGAWMARNQYGNRNSQYGWRLTTYHQVGLTHPIISAPYNGKTMWIRVTVGLGATSPPLALRTLRRADGQQRHYLLS